MPIFEKSLTSNLYNSLKDETVGYDGKFRKRERRLQDRCNLAIEFPQPKDRVVRAFIPFLENPTISERGKANLNTYNLTGRAGQLFSYGGAESRSLNVTFQITLLHLLEMEAELDQRFQQLFKVYFSEGAKAAAAFGMSKVASKTAAVISNTAGIFRGDSVEDRQKAASEAASKASEEAYNNTFRNNLNVTKGVDQDNAAIHRDYYREVAGLLTQQQELDENDNFVRRMIDSKFLGGTSRGDEVKRINRVLNLFIFYVNLIRASVLNNSENSVYGPPILRLNHGTMYNNIPCLLKGYTINIVDDAGYEVQTLTPKRVSISLELVESRAGNFANFKAGDLINGDNLTGWESIIETSNMDPYNGLVLGGEYVGKSKQDEYRGVNLK